MNRRGLLAAAAGLPAAALAAAAPMGAAASAGSVVLVHGAWHGGWCWRPVAERLRAAGYRVLTPTLSGLGERHHLSAPEVGLETHKRDLIGVLEAEELTDAVLVAHSYGGYPATLAAAAAPGRIARLFYLDALVPVPGRSMLADAPDEAVARARASLIDGFRLPPFAPEAFGVTDAHPAGRAWLSRRLTDMPFACFTEPARLDPAALAGIARRYIACTRPPLLPDARKGRRIAAAAGWPVSELDAAHDAMVTAPARLAGHLTALITADKDKAAAP